MNNWIACQMFVLTIRWTHETTRDQATEEFIGTSPDDYPMGGKEIAGSEVQRIKGTPYVGSVGRGWIISWNPSFLNPLLDMFGMSHPLLCSYPALTHVLKEHEGTNLLLNTKPGVNFFQSGPINCLLPNQKSYPSFVASTICLLCLYIALITIWGFP